MEQYGIWLIVVGCLVSGFAFVFLGAGSSGEVRHTMRLLLFSGICALMAGTVIICSQVRQGEVFPIILLPLLESLGVFLAFIILDALLEHRSLPWDWKYRRR